MLRDGLLRRTEDLALQRGDVEVQEDGSARLHVRRSNTDPEGESAVLYVGSEAAGRGPGITSNAGVKQARPDAA